jgi:hypothetical protein
VFCFFPFYLKLYSTQFDADKKRVPLLSLSFPPRAKSFFSRATLFVCPQVSRRVCSSSRASFVDFALGGVAVVERVEARRTIRRKKSP